jgi:hypothetical protein
VSDTGQKKISSIANGLIEMSSCIKYIAIHTRQCPSKYAPPSPKNIFPNGKFKTRKPAIIGVIERHRMLKLWWPAEKAINDNDTEMEIAVSAASPFNPSIKLNALVTPAEAKTVNMIPMGA